MPIRVAENFTELSVSPLQNLWQIFALLRMQFILIARAEQ